MNRLAILLTGFLLLMGIAMAQESQSKEKVRSFTWTQQVPLTVTPQGGDMMFQRAVPSPDGEISFFSAELASGGEVVTAAPYTATAVTESTQVLSDGNRIVNKTSSFVARDSQGRTRRETTLDHIGPLQVESPKMIFINDPTNHTQYILTPGDNTKVKRDFTWTSGPTIIDLHGGDEIHTRALKEKMIARSSATGGEKADENSKQVKHEELGMQTIEGVPAEGKRDTITIAAGQIGNERPIEMVTETWFSPDLHTVVLRKHSDPRMGETVFRLTDIKRIEPDPALFQAPAGTRMKVEPLLELKRREAPPKE